MRHQIIPPGPRAGQRQRHADMAVQIVDVAERIVAAEGLDALTMQRLGKELGYRPGALYRYHPSKDAVVAALIGRLVAAIAAAVTAADADAKRLATGADPVDTALIGVAAILAAYLRIAAEQPSLMGLLARFLADPVPVVPDSATLPEVVPAALATLARTAGVFGIARSAGAFAPGDGDAERVIIAWNALHGLVTTRKLGRFGVLDPARLARTTAITLLVGFGADLSRATRAVQLTFTEAS
jgi:AcrR family transcriptional regulator